MEGKKSYKISKRPLYREEIKKALMDAIVSGQLAPGDRIVETRWAKELGVSQSPIREAIRELELIGLVETIPYKGCIVRKITHKDLIDTFEVRIALESIALEEIIQRHNVESILQQMEDKLKHMLEHAAEGSIEGFIEYDVQFHEAFVENSDNALLKRLSAVMSRESLMELGRRHELICEAIRSRDTERVKKEIQVHFEMLIHDMQESEEE